jgi:hypothetical protein
MKYTGSDNMTFTAKSPLSYQKINGICALMTAPADNMKIEIPINIIIERYAQQACISNLLVTVFAALHLDKLLFIDNSLTLNYCIYGRRPQTPAARDGANTAP